MIKVVNAYTQELDDPGKAVGEILGAFDMKNGFLRNSVALLFCHSKFIETGIAESVYKSLPFDVLGCTSRYFGLSVITDASGTADAPAVEGGVMLTVTILTSDDIEFTTGISGSFNKENVDERVRELYSRTSSSLGEPPSLVFAFPPMMIGLPADIMTASLDRACGGVPVFGSAALDMSTRIRHPKTIYKSSAGNGASAECGTFGDRMVLLLFKGPVKPRFFHSTFPEKSILSWDAVITEADGNRIISINNRPALLFINEQGFLQTGAHDDVMIYPLVVEYPGGDTDVVVILEIDPEGHIMCSRNVRAGGLLNIGAITADSVLESAKLAAREFGKGGDGSVFLVFSCFLRNIVLGGSSRAEVELVSKELEGFKGSWLFFNSGGELCPVSTENGELANRFHQYALIACRF